MNIKKLIAGIILCIQLSTHATQNTIAPQNTIGPIGVLQQFSNNIITLPSTAQILENAFFPTTQSTSSLELQLISAQIFQNMVAITSAALQKDGREQLKNILYKGTAWEKISTDDISKLSNPLDLNKPLPPSIHYLDAFIAIAPQLHKLLFEMGKNNQWGILQCPFNDACKTTIEQIKTQLKNLFTSLSTKLFNNLYTTTNTLLSGKDITDIKNIAGINLNREILSVYKQSVIACNTLFPTIDKYTIQNALYQKTLTEATYIASTFSPTLKTINDYKNYLAISTLEDLKNLLHPEYKNKTMEQLIDPKNPGYSADNSFYFISNQSFWLSMIKIFPYLNPLVSLMYSEDFVNNFCEGTLDRGLCQNIKLIVSQVGSFASTKLNSSSNYFYEIWKTAQWDINVANQKAIIEH